MFVKKRKEDAPNYRPSPYEDRNCGNCIHGGDGYCDAFTFNYSGKSVEHPLGWICNAYEPMTKQYDKHVPPSEVMHNAQRGSKLFDHLPPEHQTMDTTKVGVMRGLAVGRPMSKEELDALDAHHTEFPQHPDKHVHLGMGGRAGRSWVKRIKRMNGTTEKAVGAEPPHRVNGDTYPVDTAAGATSASKSIDLYGTITKRDDEQQIVFGFASVVQENGKTIVDQQGDIVTPAELEKMAYDYVLHCRDLGEMHEAKGKGKLVESMVFTPEKCKALGISDFGKVAWWIGMKVSDAKVWSKVKNGDYKSFSIHGSGKREKLDDGDISATELKRQ